MRIFDELRQFILRDLDLGGVTRRFPGDGVRRAEARLAAKRKANALIPDCPIETRQRRRAEERARAKAYRSVQKREALKNKLPGGAAVIR